MGEGLDRVDGRGDCVKRGLWEGRGDHVVRGLRRLQWRKWRLRRHDIWRRGRPLRGRRRLGAVGCTLVACAHLGANKSNFAAQRRDVLSDGLRVGVVGHLHVPHNVCNRDDAVVVLLVDDLCVVGVPNIGIVADIPGGDVNLVGLAEVMFQGGPILIDWIYAIPFKEGGSKNTRHLDRGDPLTDHLVSRVGGWG